MRRIRGVEFLSRQLRAASVSVRSLRLLPSEKTSNLTPASGSVRSVRSASRLPGGPDLTCNLIPGKCRAVPCCLSLNPRYSSVASVLPDVEDSLWRQVIKYSKYRPSPLSLSSFIHHGENSSREISYNFLKREVPTRLAGLLLEFNLLPQPLQRQTDVEAVRAALLNTFQDLLELPSNPQSDVLETFEETLKEIRARHADTVAKMAGAVMNMKFSMESESHSVEGVEAAVQYFLDRLYMTNISTRMLLNQHLYIFGDNIAKCRHVGQIDPYCDVVGQVRRAHSEAGRLCDLHYQHHPELQVISNNRSSNESKDTPISLAYVQSHLHHMLFEVMKNSMRATVENCDGQGIPLSPITVFVSKTEQDITIKISDTGGGIPRSQMKNLFKYMFTTAGSSRVDRAHRQVEESSLPLMAGLGYGLPLSRLYARYFQGELNVSSMHGTGTDCYIYLRSMQEKAPEQIPIYSAMTSKTYKDKSEDIPDDWTGAQEVEGGAVK